MSHFPVDHPLRGFYRGLAFLIGVGLVVFGVIAFVQASSVDWFGTHGVRVLGLTANRGFAVISIVVGAMVAGVTAIGRNLDAAANLVGSVVFMGAGLGMLALLRTPLNFLAFSMTNVIVSFFIGVFLMLAGLYGSVSRQGRSADIGHRAADEAAAR